MHRALLTSSHRLRLRRCCSTNTSARDSNVIITARSLRDVARAAGSSAVRELLLPASQDLVCKNMMCEHLGDPCACKLSLALERLPQLQTMDLSRNALHFLPEAAFALTQLTHLDLSHNALTELSPRIADLQHLCVLDLRDNRLVQLPVDALLALPHLQQVLVAGNPLANAVASLPDPLRAKLIAVRSTANTETMSP